MEKLSLTKIQIKKNRLNKFTHRQQHYSQTDMFRGASHSFDFERMLTKLVQERNNETEN